MNKEKEVNKKEVEVAKKDSASAKANDKPKYVLPQDGDESSSNSDGTGQVAGSSSEEPSKK